jgi:hypothetical protein
MEPNFSVAVLTYFPIQPEQQIGIERNGSMRALAYLWKQWQQCRRLLVAEIRVRVQLLLSLVPSSEIQVVVVTSR